MNCGLIAFIILFFTQKKNNLLILTFYYHYDKVWHLLRKKTENPIIIRIKILTSKSGFNLMKINWK